MRDDRILFSTRAILSVVVPILWAAFILLYLFPQSTAATFAWDIQPPLTAMLMGAGYIGGSFQFVYAIFGRRWHRVANAFLPVTSFTIFMLVATFLHWDRFIHSHFTFYVWLVVYLITPFLVPWMWLANRKTDPGVPEEHDLVVPFAIRLFFGAIGVLLLIFAVYGFIFPQALIPAWPWKVTPLTMRVLCGWSSLLGVGGLILYVEPRWSARRYGMQSIGLWHALMILACLLRRGDFKDGSLLNPFFIIVVFNLLLIISLYAWFEGSLARSKSGVQDQPRASNLSG
jgi:hypothetical protein